MTVSAAAIAEAGQVHPFVRNLAELAAAAVEGRLEATQTWDGGLPAHFGKQAWRPSREREAQAVEAVERQMLQAAAAARADTRVRRDTDTQAAALQEQQAVFARHASAGRDWNSRQAMKTAVQATGSDTENALLAAMRSLCILPWPTPILRLMMRRRGWL